LGFALKAGTPPTFEMIVPADALVRTQSANFSTLLLELAVGRTSQM
jgi:hypothetical protein